MLDDLSNLVTSVILAGGQGTRLFPLTQNRCKPFVSFGGSYRLIDVPISNSLNAQIKRMFVISQYFASDLQQHIFETYRLDLLQKTSIEMLCPEESQQGGITLFRGTADAVRQTMKYLLKSPVDYFLILSGDQLYNIDFKEMLKFAIHKKADLVIASLPVKIMEAKRMGLLKIDKNNSIVDFHEKPKEEKILNRFEQEDGLHYLGSMGIYIFKREALISLLKGEGHDFGHDLIPEQIKKGKTFAFIYDGYWEDIGTIHSFYHANLALLKQKHCLNTYDEQSPIFAHPHFLPSALIKNTKIENSYICQGSIIECKEISNSILGLRTHVKEGTVIKDTIILGNHYYISPRYQNLPKDFSIGENCHIEKAIIDEHISIGNNVNLINKSNHENYDGDGIYVRDGIIIVTTGTKIPDNFIF